MVKWIAMILGYSIFKLPGAVVGLILGSLLDIKVKKYAENIKKTSNKIEYQDNEVTPGDFELHLLSLSSIVIKVDGQVNQKELDYVRQYFVNAYGKDHANATFRVFNEVIKNRDISAQRICVFLVKHTRYAVRLQILHFLFGIANADGQVSQTEAQEIGKIAGFLRLNRSDFESIKAMFFKTADQGYKILEIKKTATDAEVKKAYRTMVKKYHPDKVQHMDEVHIKGAEAKFKEVQKAYEEIQKERGLN